MKRIIERIIIIVWIMLFLFLSTTFLTQCSMMYGNGDLSSDNLRYYTHNIFKNCFASAYLWTSDDKYAVLDIPDTCEGYRVTALGGYIGSGGPCPFIVHLPDAHSICSESALPDDAQIEQYHLVINIGKHLRDDKFIIMDDYHEVGSKQFVQILVTINCSPENPYFYSEDGKLYKRLDHSLVDGFFYYSDYYG